LERALQGSGKRILLKLIIERRNKFSCKLAYFIPVFIILSTLSLPKTMDVHPSHAPRWSRHRSLPPYTNADLVWLVVVYEIFDQCPSKAKVYYNFVFFQRLNCHPNQSNNVPPHAPHPPRLLSDIPPTAAANSYLIVAFSFKVLAPLGRGTISPLLFYVSSFHLPNRQTSHFVAKPNHGHLLWDHRDPRRHWLGAPIACPWREMAKPVEGRVAAAHFGCCVLCVVCCGCDEF
jgi:hypothetical protein